MAAGHVSAQVYPVKPIRMVAPEPGGGNEVAGRMIARGLSEQLGQTFVVENRGSASGAIAGEILAKRRPTGIRFSTTGAPSGFCRSCGRRCRSIR